MLENQEQPPSMRAMLAAQTNARMELPLPKATGNYIIGTRFATKSSVVAMSTPQDLKTAGLKATLPRLKIINLFEQSPVRHLTAEDVYRQLLADGLDVGLATVYRVLTQFEQAGLLVRHHFE